MFVKAPQLCSGCFGPQLLLLLLLLLLQVKGLTLQDQFTLVNAPIDVYDAVQRGAFIDFARTYAAGQPVLFNEALMPEGPPRTEGDMEEAEDLHKARRRTLCSTPRACFHEE
jgi:hypothetical protein